MKTINVRRAADDTRWIADLRHRRAAARINARNTRLARGLFGDMKPVGSGVSELRIHCGPGYRVYITQEGDTLLVLLCGGDKSTQQSDIRRAKMLAAMMRGDDGA